MVDLRDVRLRDKACRIALDDPAAAEDLARKIKDPWYRAQAYTSAATAAPGSDLTRLARAAAKAIEQVPRPYGKVFLGGGLFTCLLNRDRQEAAYAQLELALQVAPTIDPPSGQAQALVHVLPAVLEESPEHRRRILNSLATLYAQDWSHWRTSRSFREAMALAQEHEPDLVAHLAKGATPKEDRRLQRAMGKPTPPPPGSHIPLSIDKDGIGPLWFDEPRGEHMQRLGKPSHQEKRVHPDGSCSHLWTYTDWYLKGEFHQQDQYRLGTIHTWAPESLFKGVKLIGASHQELKGLHQRGILPGLSPEDTDTPDGDPTFACSPPGLGMRLHMRGDVVGSLTLTLDATPASPAE